MKRARCAPRLCSTLRSYATTLILVASLQLTARVLPAAEAPPATGTTEQRAPRQDSADLTTEGTPATPTEQAERERALRTRYAEGEAAFQAGRFEEAAALFQQVYRAKPLPNILYNIARCFEELRRYESAISFYEQYLAEEPESEDRAQVNLSIEALRGLSQRTVAERRRRRLRWTAYGGAALLYVVATALSFATASTRSELDSALATQISPARYRELQDRGAAQAIWADSLFLVGSGVLGLGLYLHLTPTSAETAQTEGRITQALFAPTSSGTRALSWTF